jgi:hypothetical protein
MTNSGTSARPRMTTCPGTPSGDCPGAPEVLELDACEDRETIVWVARKWELEDPAFSTRVDEWLVWKGEVRGGNAEESALFVLFQLGLYLDDIVLPRGWNPLRDRRQYGDD